MGRTLVTLAGLGGILALTLLFRPLEWLAPLGWLLLLWEVGLAGVWTLVLLVGDVPDMALPLALLLLGLVGIPVASGVLGLLRWWALGRREPWWWSYGVAVLTVNVTVLTALGNGFNLSDIPVPFT